MPKTLNSLMKHLRDGGIAIDGSAQKRRLKNIGYYHGYKGYRFAGNASNRLPLTDFSQVSIAASSGGDSAMRQCANPLAIGARLRRQSGWESFCSQPFFELSVARLPRSSR